MSPQGRREVTMFEARLRAGRRIRKWSLSSRTGLVPAIVVVVVATTTFAAEPALARTPSTAKYAKGQLWSPRPEPTMTSVAGADWHRPAVAAGSAKNSMKAPPPTAPIWPPAATATVTPQVANLATDTSSRAGAKTAIRPATGPVSAVGTPVAVGAARVARPGAMTPAAVQVHVADHATATAAGIDGLLLSVMRTDAATTPGRAEIQVSYADFASAFGGGYAARMQLVLMPQCVLTTPTVPVCQTQTPLQSVNDPQGRTVSADVDLGPAAPTGTKNAATTAAQTSTASSMMVLAATSAPSGSSGTYTASSLKPSDSWSAGGSTGGFDYTYPVTVPPSLGGTAPDVSLNYSSHGADGKTSATNTQSGWVGESWSTLADAYIERSYESCNNDGQSGDYDLCYPKENLTLSMTGHAGQMVRDDASGTWKLQIDDGTKVEQLTNVPFGNGTNAGEYFRVTTTDGTQYIFGANHLPTGNGSDPASNAAWTVPVYGADAGTPCHAAAFSASECTQGWRFNLAYVIDPHNNLTSYQYATETNYYMRGGSSGTLTQYVRGGYLTSISYGTSVADAVAGKQPAAKVLFTSAERCLTSTTVCQYSNLSSSTASNWPDVPYDQNCGSSGTCNVISPTFWSTKRLTGITTQVLVGSAYSTVDSYALGDEFLDPGDGTGQDLWLNTITRTATDNGSITLPAVTFTPVEMKNRVDGLTSGGQGLPPMWHPRMSTITDEAGGKTSVTYSTPQCTNTAPAVMPSAPGSNILMCYPDYWTPTGQTTPILDWFDNYTVSSIEVSDQTGLAPPKMTSYSYLGTPAWHSNDSELTPAAQRTWDDFRGFSQVITSTGAAPDQLTATEATYLRGMDQDLNASGATPAVTVNDSQGGTYTDDNALAGFTLETQTLTAAGGQVAADSIDVPYLSAPTATHVRVSPLPKQYARIHGTAKTLTRSLKNDGATWQTREVDNSYDAIGRLTSSDDKGDGTAAGEVCTAYSYATSSGNPMMLSYKSRILALNAPCGTTPTATNTVSDTRNFYDTGGQSITAAEGTFGKISGPGDPTTTEVVDHYNGGTTPVYVAASQATFDAYGRSLSSTDPNATDAAHPNGATTTTAYTPVTGALPTAVTTTNPLGWVTTATLDPLRQVTTHSVDPNGRVTDETFDALGRATAVWLPGRSISTQSANKLFSYSMSGGTSPVVIQTQTLRDDGSYGQDFKIYDGTMQPRQEQTSAPDGSTGREITDTFHDSHGWVVKTSAGYYNSSAPSGTVYQVNDTQIPQQTVTTYDGQGRTTASATYSYSQFQWQTTTSYRGSTEKDISPPAGGRPSTVITDIWGHTTQTWAYNTASATGNAGDAAVTQYTYYPSGQQHTVTDAGNHTWTYTYDLRGHRLTTSDPDMTGLSSSFYDSDGRVAYTTDPRGDALAYSYDLLSRKTAEYAATTTTDPTTMLSSWAYDSKAKGYPDSSTRYVGGQSGSAYVTAVKGYTTDYLSTGSVITIPAAEGTLAGTYTTSSTYTANARLLAKTFLPAAGGMSAETLSYSYGLGGLQVGVGGAHDYLTGQTYTPLGQPQRATLGDMPLQTVLTNVWDQATGHLLSQTLDKENGTTSADIYSFTYNQAGSPTSAQDKQDNGSVDLQCYAYDSSQRLAGVWTDTGGVATAASPSAPGIGGCTDGTPSATTIGGPAAYWQSYTYDAIGNRLTRTDHDVTGNTANDTQRSYSPEPNQPHQLQSTAVTGGTTAGPTGTDSFTYDAAGNEQSRSLATGVNDGLVFDNEGRLTKVTNATTSTTISSYLYAADGSLLLQRDPSDVTLFLPGQEVHLKPATGTTSALRFITTPIGATVVESSAGTLTYSLANPQNTASVEIDASTLNVTRRYFDPYGNPRGPVPQVWSDTHGFLGKTVDGAAGLDMIGARAYDASAGRFVSRDPIFQTGDAEQMGGYTYAGNNPVEYTDPSGLTRCDADPGICSKATQESVLGESGDSSSGAAGDAGSSDGSDEPTSDSDPWWKIWSPRHDTAVIMAAMQIKESCMACDVTIDQAANAIPKGSLKDNTGYADIMSMDANTGITYIWEVKNAGGPAQEEGVAQLAKYVQAKKVACSCEVQAGYGLANMGPVQNIGNPTEVINAWSGTGVYHGLVLYKAEKGDGDPLRPPFPFKVPEKMKSYSNFPDLSTGSGFSLTLNPTAVGKAIGTAIVTGAIYAGLVAGNALTGGATN